MPVIQAPDRGINTQLPENQIDPRETTGSSRNTIYRNGEIRKPFGYVELGANSLPLDSSVIGIAKYPEVKTNIEHLLCATNTKIYKLETIAATWTDITNVGGDNVSSINNPSSWASIGHTDEVDSSFQHMLYCDGGITAVQRWAGNVEANFKDLLGASGYNDPASTVNTHFAQKVDIFNNHVILISAQEATSIDVMIANNQRVRWGATGKLETYDGITSGFVDLFDTGGKNVWGEKLGNRYIVYQNNSVWGLNPVGGSTIFEPEILLPDLGLLAPQLITSTNNVHYFVGDDFNVYAYLGGSVRQRISDNPLKFFRDDIDDSFVNRCWLRIGAENKRLWLFYVPDDKEYMTHAIALDLQDGQWMPRDFDHVPAYAGNKGTSTGGGFTSIELLGSEITTTGQTYAQAVSKGQTYAQAVTSTVTYAATLEQSLVADRLALGDSNGNIYQYSSDVTTDDGTAVPLIHYTPVFDLQLPDAFKRWHKFSVTAKGDTLLVEYSADDGAWVEASPGSISLTSEYEEYEFYLNETARRMQFRMSNNGGESLRIREYGGEDPTVEENR